MLIFCTFYSHICLILSYHLFSSFYFVFTSFRHFISFIPTWNPFFLSFPPFFPIFLTHLESFSSSCIPIFLIRFFYFFYLPLFTHFFYFFNHLFIYLLTLFKPLYWIFFLSSPFYPLIIPPSPLFPLGVCGRACRGCQFAIILKGIGRHDLALLNGLR